MLLFTFCFENISSKCISFTGQQNYSLHSRSDKVILWAEWSHKSLLLQWNGILQWTSQLIKITKINGNRCSKVVDTVSRLSNSEEFWLIRLEADGEKGLKDWLQSWLVKSKLSSNVIGSWVGSFYINSDVAKAGGHVFFNESKIARSGIIMNIW